MLTSSTVLSTGLGILLTSLAGAPGCGIWAKEDKGETAENRTADRSSGRIVKNSRRRASEDRMARTSEDRMIALFA